MTSNRKGMPRGWLKPAWVVDFAKESPLAVVDDPAFYCWIRDNHYPCVTVLQYRVAIRRMVSPMGAGYRAVKLPQEISEPLRAAVEELGKKMWGFQKTLQSREASAASLKKSNAAAAKVKCEKSIEKQTAAATEQRQVKREEKLLVQPVPLRAAERHNSIGQNGNQDSFSIHSTDLLLPSNPTPPQQNPQFSSGWLGPMMDNTNSPSYYHQYAFQDTRPLHQPLSSESDSGSESDSYHGANSAQRVSIPRGSNSDYSSPQGSMAGSKRRISRSWEMALEKPTEDRYEPTGVHLENLRHISMSFYSLNVSGPEDDLTDAQPRCPQCSSNPAAPSKCSHRGWHQSLPTVTETNQRMEPAKENLLELTREFYSLGSSQCHYQLTEREMLAHFKNPDQVGFFVSPKGRIRNKLCTVYCNQSAVDLLQADPCKEYFPIFHRDYLQGFTQTLQRATNMDFPLSSFKEALMYTSDQRVIVVDIFMQLHQRGELYCWFRLSPPSQQRIKPASDVVAQANIIDLLTLSNRI